MSYLDKDAFAALSTIPAEFLDAIEDVAPGWIDAQLVSWSRQIDARLAKRYAVPFAEPAPDIVTAWLARIVTLQCYMKRGVDPSDIDMDFLRADYQRALDEIKEAADAQFGLFDLPLRADTTKSGISKGGPFAYTEASPYAWTDEQGRVGRGEDSRRGGTFHG